MHTQEPSLQSPSAAMMTRSWQASLFVGIVTLILGIIVAAHPTGSLNVIAVLLGILLIISGIFHLIRVFDTSEPHRVWLGIAGLLFIVAGVILIRHLHLTRAIIGLFIGITWIIQGVVALIAGISGGSREGRGWWIAFGVISIIAGIVVTATPASSLSVLAVLFGIWFIVMGIFEIIGAFMIRRALRTEGPPPG
ncbi:MAG TPA: HdeD family acid-resistance protein [Streptosporangiaceae bacterium]